MRAPLEPATRVLEDMAEYGIIASVNPVFNWQEGAAFLTNLGPERFARTKPFRSYVEAGVVLNSGSDYPVTSHDPWIGMYALMTRRSQADGEVYGPDETLDLEQALRWSQRVLDCEPGNKRARDIRDKAKSEY